MTQAAQILRALKRGQRLTPLEALRDFSCMRLGARIHELKRAGFPIQSERIEVKPGTYVSRYSMRRAAQ